MYLNMFIHLLCFDITNFLLRTSKFLAKDASQCSCSQCWGYTILRTSMTPWAVNLIFNYLIKLFVTLIKPHTHCGIINPWKQQIRYLEEKKNEIFLLPFHWFFTNDSTTTKTYFITYDGKPIFKSWCTTQICWPFASKAKCWTLEFSSSYPPHLDVFMFEDLKAQKLCVVNL